MFGARTHNYRRDSLNYDGRTRALYFYLVQISPSSFQESYMKELDLSQWSKD
jgi:hypothetical protein